MLSADQSEISESLPNIRYHEFNPALTDVMGFGQEWLMNRADRLADPIARNYMKFSVKKGYYLGSFGIKLIAGTDPKVAAETVAIEIGLDYAMGYLLRSASTPVAVATMIGHLGEPIYEATMDYASKRGEWWNEIISQLPEHQQILLMTDDITDDYRFAASLLKPFIWVANVVDGVYKKVTATILNQPTELPLFVSKLGAAETQPILVPFQHENISGADDTFLRPSLFGREFSPYQLRDSSTGLGFSSFSKSGSYDTSLLPVTGFNPAFQKILISHGYAPLSKSVLSTSMPDLNNKPVLIYDSTRANNNNAWQIDTVGLHFGISTQSFPARPPLKDYSMRNPFENMFVSANIRGPQSYDVVVGATLPLTGWSLVGGLVFTGVVWGGIKLLEWREEKAYASLASKVADTQADYNDVNHHFRQGLARAEQLLTAEDVMGLRQFIAGISDEVGFVTGKRDNELSKRIEKLADAGGISKKDKKAQKQAYKSIGQHYTTIANNWSSLRISLSLNLALLENNEAAAIVCARQLPTEQCAMALKQIDSYFRFSEKVMAAEQNFSRLSGDYDDLVSKLKADPKQYQANVGENLQAITAGIIEQQELLASATGVVGVDPKVIGVLQNRLTALEQAKLVLNFSQISSPSEALELFQNQQRQLQAMMSNENEPVALAVVQSKLQALDQQVNELIQQTQQKINQQEEIIAKGLKSSSAQESLAANKELLQSLELEKQKLQSAEQQCALFERSEQLLQIEQILTQESLNLLRDHASAGDVNEFLQTRNVDNLKLELQQLRLDYDHILQSQDIDEKQRIQIERSRNDLIRSQNKIAFASAIDSMVRGEISKEQHLEMLSKDLSPEEAAVCYVFGGNLYRELKLTHDAMVMYQKALAVNQKDMDANRGAASIYAISDQLDKAVEQLYLFRGTNEAIDKELAQYETDFALQLAAPVMSAMGILARDHLGQNKQWHAKEYALFGLYAIAELHPQLLPAAARWLICDDQFTQDACVISASRMFESLTNTDETGTMIRSWSRLLISVVQLDTLAPFIPQAIKANGVVELVNVAHQVVTAHDALMLDQPHFARAYFASRLVSAFFQNCIYNTRAPETVAELAGLDFATNLPQLLVTLASPNKLFKLVSIGSSLLLYPFRYRTYHKQAALNFAANTRGLVLRGDIEAARVRYETQTEQKNEHDFVEQSYRHQELRVFQYGVGNENDTVDITLARHLLVNTVLDVGFQRSEVKLQNQYIGQLKALAGHVVALDQKDMTHQLQAQGYEAYATVAQQMGFSSTAENAFENAANESANALVAALNKRNRFVRVTDWLKEQTGIGETSTAQHAKNLDRARRAVRNQQRYTTQASSGSFQSGFGLHFQRVYAMRLQQNIRSEMLIHETQMVIILSHLFADRIILMDDKDANNFNSYQALQILIQLAIDADSSSLRALAHFLRKKMQLTEHRVGELPMLSFDAKQPQPAPQTVMEKFIVELQSMPLVLPAERPVELDLLEQFLALSSGDRAVEQVLLDRLKQELFTQTATGVVFKYKHAATADTGKSLVELYLIGLLLSHFLIAMYKNKQAYPEVMNFEAEIHDTIMGCGFMPRFSDAIAEYFKIKFGLNFAQVKTLLDRYDFDGNHYWSVRKRFLLIARLYRSTLLDGPDLTLHHVNVFFGEIVRGLLNSNANGIDLAQQNTLEFHEIFTTFDNEDAIIHAVLPKLKSGADPNFSGINEQIPLFIAVQKGWARLAALLCDYGARINTVDSRGITVLQFCAILYIENANPNLVTIENDLIKRGANRQFTTQISWYRNWSWWWNYGNKSAEDLLASQYSRGLLERSQLAVLVPAAMPTASIAITSRKQYVIEDQRLQLMQTTEAIQTAYGTADIRDLLSEASGVVFATKIEPKFVNSLILYLIEQRKQKINPAAMASSIICSQWNEGHWVILYFPAELTKHKPKLIFTVPKLPFQKNLIEALLDGMPVEEYQPVEPVTANDSGPWVVKMTSLLFIAPEVGVVARPTSSNIAIRMNEQLPCLQQLRAKRQKAKANIDDGVEEKKSEATPEVVEIKQEVKVEQAEAKVDPPLVVAAKNGELQKVVQLVREKEDLELVDTIEKATALHWASAGGHMPVVECLVDHGAKIDAKHLNAIFSGSTPLAWAAYFGKDAVVIYLLQHGADPYSFDSRNKSPLMIAQERDHVVAAKQIRNQQLILACHKGDLNEVKQLLDNGAEIECHDLREKSSGDTPLTAAVSQGHTAVARELLQRQANVHGRNRKLDTPLTLAAIRGSTELLELLLNHNAAIDLRGSQNRTALGYAAQHGRLNAVQYLLEKGADAYMLDAENKPALVNAREAKQMDCVNELESVLRPKLCNAVYHNDETQVRRLLQAGTNSNINFTAPADYAGWTFLSYAIYQRFYGVASALLEYDADPNVKIPQGEWAGWSPLAYLIYEDKAEVLPLVRLLLKHNASPSEVFVNYRWRGWSLLNYAAYKIGEVDAYLEVAQCLIYFGAEDNQILLNGIFGNRSLMEYLIVRGGKHRELIETLCEKGCKLAVGSSFLSPSIPLYEYDKQTNGKEDIVNYWLRGHHHFYAGRYQDAIVEYQKILAQRPHNAFANYYLARCNFNLNQIDNALIFVTRALELNSSVVEFYSLRARCYWKNENFTDAYPDFEKITQLQSNQHIHWNNLGCTSTRLQKYDKAADYFTKAVELKPDCAMYYNNRAQAYIHLNEYLKAARDFQKSQTLQLSEESIVAIRARNSAWGNMGVYYANALYYKQQQQWDNALAEIVKAEAECINYQKFKDETLTPLRLEIQQLRQQPPAPVVRPMARAPAASLADQLRHSIHAARVVRATVIEVTPAPVISPSIQAN